MHYNITYKTLSYNMQQYNTTRGVSSTWSFSAAASAKRDCRRRRRWRVPSFCRIRSGACL